MGRHLRSIRGRPKLGGRGTLYRYSVYEACSIWANLRSAYLGIWAARGANVKQLSSRLDAKWEKRASQCQLQRQQWQLLEQRRSERQRRREARREQLESRKRLALQKREA